MHTSVLMAALSFQALVTPFKDPDGGLVAVNVLVRK
jgi:hypothetical protein